MRWLLIAVLAVGCSVQARPISMQDGTQGAAIRCRWESKCFAKAEAICPHGYEVLNSAVGWDKWVSMTVVCKSSATAGE